MLSILDPDVWDKYRNQYDSLTNLNHKNFYRQLIQAYPEQKHYNEGAFTRALNNLMYSQSKWKITEIGGYDGSLAKSMLKKFENITWWTNYDIVPKPVQMDRYSAIEVDFHWMYDSPFTVHFSNQLLVATHTIEHLSNEDFKVFLRAISEFDHVYFEAPLHQSEKADWSGYIGTHVLTYSWDQIEAMMDFLGYACETFDKGCKLFTRY